MNHVTRATPMFSFIRSLLVVQYLAIPLTAAPAEHDGVIQRTYPVRNVLARYPLDSEPMLDLRGAEVDKSIFPIDSLLSIIHGTTGNPLDWKESGGERDEATLKNARLTVTAPDWVHAEVAALLGHLVRNGPDLQLKTPLPAKTKLHLQKLNTPILADPAPTTIGELMALISTSTEVASQKVALSPPHPTSTIDDSLPIQLKSRQASAMALIDEAWASLDEKQRKQYAWAVNDRGVVIGNRWAVRASGYMLVVLDIEPVFRREKTAFFVTLRGGHLTDHLIKSLQLDEEDSGISVYATDLVVRLPAQRVNDLVSQVKEYAKAPPKLD